MKYRISLILFNMLLLSSCSYAKKEPIQCKVSTPDWANEFNKVYRVDEFSIYYSDLDSSPHKIPQTQDTNHNKIPDYVENIAIQAQNSRDMFHLAGFRSPLKSPRYQNNAENIAIFLKKIDGNGAAFEIPAQHPNIAKKMSPMQCSLALVVSNNLENFPSTWATVTHELFHLYQYGYTQFKNSWYLESLANWADRAVKVDITPNTKKLPPLPQSTQAFEEQVYKKTYTHIWRRLFLINNSDILQVPEKFKERTYIGGQKVFLDHEWRGTKFVVKFMQDMEKESDQITQQRSWPAYNWKEKDQRRPEWNPVIYSLIQKQLQQPQYDQTEIQFMRKVDLKTLNSE